MNAHTFEAYLEARARAEALERAHAMVWSQRIDCTDPRARAIVEGIEARMNERLILAREDRDRMMSLWANDSTIPLNARMAQNDYLLARIAR